jgi:hypothetical protein
MIKCKIKDAVARLSEGLEMMVASGEQIDLPGTAVPLQSQLRLLGELYGSKRPPQRLLGKFFTSLRKMIATAQEEWGTSKAKRNELEIDHCTEFYRLWSCLIFAFSLPSADNDGLSNRIRFGDALLWAGCTIVKILGEDRRFKAFDFIRFLTYVISLDTRGIVANDAVWCIRLLILFLISLCGLDS